MINSFFNNMTFSIAFIYMGMKLKEYLVRKNKGSFIWKWTLPILTGLMATFIMFDHFQYKQLILDLRFMPIYLLSYVGGWQLGIIAGILPAFYRLYLGGSMVWFGIIVDLIVPIIIGGLFANQKSSFPVFTRIDLKKIFGGFGLTYFIRAIAMMNVIDSYGDILVKLVINQFFSSAIILFAMVLMVNDFNSKQLSKRELEKSEDRYRTLVEILPVPISVHKEDEVIYANQAAVDTIGGLDKDSIIGTSIYEYIYPECRAKARTRINKVQRGETVDFKEQKFIRSDGKVIDTEVKVVRTKYMGQEALISVFKDISERKKNEKKMEHMALHDALTGLPNRYLLDDYLKKYLARAKRNEYKLGIMFIDLDRLKRINDTLGHDIGDKVLKQVAQRLGESMRENDVICRQGGDEFIIVLDQVEGENHITKVGDRILDHLSEPYIINDIEVYATPSIGISIYPDDGMDGDELVKMADMAMYHAKKNGGNDYQFYSEELNTKNERRLKLESRLVDALEYQEFILHYQPQIDLQSSNVVGVEALIRWQHPELGLVPPNEFIYLAEETGLIIPLGNWVLKEACRQNMRWQKKGFAPVSMAVNVSAYQLQNKNFVTNVKQVLEETGMEAKYLELEITENTMCDMKKANDVISQLKKIGVKVSIDDFGTGYSVLNILSNISFDKLKIDKSFIAQLSSSSNMEELVKTIIQMGKTLSFNVIAEGVEDDKQIEFLKDNMCNLGQGYFFSRPVQASDLDKIFQKS